MPILYFAAEDSEPPALDNTDQPQPHQQQMAPSPASFPPCLNPNQISPTPFTDACLLSNAIGTPSFRKLSPVPPDIALSADNSVSMFRDTIAPSSNSTGFTAADSSVLVTPKKLTFADETSTLRTPKAERVLEHKLKTLGGGKSPAAKSFMRALDTPTKRAVVAIEELASMATFSTIDAKSHDQTSRDAMTSSTEVTSSTSRSNEGQLGTIVAQSPRTPAKTRKVVALLEQMAYEACSSPETSLSSPPCKKETNTNDGGQTPTRSEGEKLYLFLENVL